ncbi:hypothetical protein [Piscinibacter gummiphilus]|uniref:Uncharacterized protein n=1 Tax=Piscinibacter gummiphilus TaxID=946333 RepID=A0A1W6L3V4_9BURK|nr:hypothetical protein [Piscinibacter gummiphilus]ARN18867.1 hypothetical protein A4W93_02435 [Piscinibacter gummiphilus]ATU63512.1 hypothetical protein CPZ87_02505 [Piscinibacter gummiphilus]GLS96036.1 hypothetical protein GCM10007918_33280 [Piscinibacter gummiphilus]
MTDIDRFTTERWEHLLEEVDLEIAQSAIMCKVRLLDPGVAERLLQQDPMVWDTSRDSAFTKLRGLLVMHFTTEQQIAECIGPEEAAAIAERVRAHLRSRVGDQLGGPLAPGAEVTGSNPGPA